MGAAVGMFIFFWATIALYGVLWGLWALWTLSKYALYRILKVGNMPIRDYFKHYLNRLKEEWSF